ncbi:MAG: hypothetical protein ACLTS1_08090 [Coprococcus sp.]
MPEFDLNCNLDDYFKSKEEWIQIIQKWEGYVRKAVDNKGKPSYMLVLNVVYAVVYYTNWKMDVLYFKISDKIGRL